MRVLFFILGIISWITSSLLLYRDLRRIDREARWWYAMKLRIEGDDPYHRLLGIVKILGLVWVTAGILLLVLPKQFSEGDVEIALFFFGLVLPIGIGVYLLKPGNGKNGVSYMNHNQ